MGKLLIIAEKPSVARDIATALGGFTQAEGWHESDTAIVASAIGHLVELHVPEAETGGKDLASLPVIPRRFELRPIGKTRTQFSTLKKLMSRPDVDTVYNAADAGREGELIFRRIYELAGCTKPIKRVWLQSMRADAIREGVRAAKPGAAFDALADAARCRAEADWLVGINGSRGVTRLRERQVRAYEQMTAGRVQTPTLGIVVAREREIAAFVPKDYWEIHGRFGAEAGSYSGRWLDAAATRASESSEQADDAEAAGFRIFDRARAEAVLAKCRGVAPTSARDERRRSTSAPPKLFDLTSLQREAIKKLRISAKRTLEVAQALYETHKVLSYPRTDSSALPEDYLDEARAVMTVLAEGQRGVHARRALERDCNWSVPDKRIFDNSKISDHFAIIPTQTKPSGLSDTEAAIYDMVVRRFIAAFHPAAEYDNTTRITVVAGEHFKSTGRVLVTPGWLEVYGRDEMGDKAPALCALRDGESVRNEAMELKGLQTKPPSRYTEDTLLTAMECAGRYVDDDDARDALKERGLGTPATRAGMIEGLLATKDGQGRPKEPYVERQGKEAYLVPTSNGKGLIDFLSANGIESLTSPRMTGDWEQKLRLMEKGQYTRAAFMAEIAAMVTGMLDVIRAKASTIPAPQERFLSVPCPKCKGTQVASNQRTFQCKGEGCGFVFWREICGRDLSDAEADQLFRDGAIKQLDGFVSKRKTKFAAGLKLNAQFRADLVFQEGPDGKEGASALRVLGVPCPKCGGVVRIKGGDYPHYACDAGDFKLWKMVAGRPLSDAEAMTLITRKVLPPVHGFVSVKTKRKFAAGLRLSRDLAKVEFEFEGG